MHIFLPIDIKPTGGTSTFAVKFQAALAQLGHTVSFKSPADYDALLVPAVCPLRYVLEAKRKHKKIIHRLDGVYYPTTTVGWSYPLHNAPMYVIRRYFADTVIYQSTYSRQSCGRFLGRYTPATEHVIYNGVDTGHFAPRGETQPLRDNPDQHVFMTASRFRRKDQIAPLLAAFANYQQTYTANAKLVLVGVFEKHVTALVRAAKRMPGVVVHPAVPNSRLPVYLRAADVFVFSHLNPPCPNNVLEAMACGLPVCGVADGAMPELVEHNVSGLLVSAHGDAWYRPRPVDTTLFAEHMSRLVAQHHRFSRASRDRAVHTFSLDSMAERYATALSS